MRWIVLVSLMAGVVYADPKEVEPLTLAGPFTSAQAACESAKPCGFTDLDPKTLKETKPQKKTVCKLDFAPDGPDAGSLEHKGNGLTMRIAAQTCAVPEGIRDSHHIYYVLVKQGDSWYRTTPLYQWDYNDKYGGGESKVRWNDRKGHTFIGLQLQRTELACGKNGQTTETLEMMLRVDPGDKAPIVFSPLLVGERWKLESFGDTGPDCEGKPITISLDEKYADNDDSLELTGVDKWYPTITSKETGILEVGVTSDPKTKVASPVGKYHFKH
ncbi:MAG: hypothetical protein QM831_26740 [Kofleriaceae bacterium]